jgi:azurin
MTVIIGAAAAARHTDAHHTPGLSRFNWRRFSMRLFAALFLFVVATLTPTAAQQPRTINIVGTDDMQYSITTMTAKPGETIRIRLVSNGTIPKVAMAHNVVVLQIGTNIDRLLKEGAAHRDTDFIPPSMASAVLAKTAMAGPGEAVQVVFTVPTKPGNYPFICTFAGHYQAGMKGTLIVK